MKRILSIPILMLYILVTFGTSIKMHLCHGEIINFSVKPLSTATSNKIDDCCESDNIKVSKSLIVIDNVCCSDINLIWKISEPQNTNQYSFQFGDNQNLNGVILSSQFQYFYNNYEIFENLSNLHGVITYAQPPPNIINKLPKFLLFENIKLDC